MEAVRAYIGLSIDCVDVVFHGPAAAFAVADARGRDSDQTYLHKAACSHIKCNEIKQTESVAVDCAKIC